MFVLWAFAAELQAVSARYHGYPMYNNNAVRYGGEIWPAIEIGDAANQLLCVIYIMDHRMWKSLAKACMSGNDSSIWISMESNQRSTQRDTKNGVWELFALFFGGSSGF